MVRPTGGAPPARALDLLHSPPNHPPCRSVLFVFLDLLHGGGDAGLPWSKYCSGEGKDRERVTKLKQVRGVQVEVRGGGWGVHGRQM